MAATKTKRRPKRDALEQQRIDAASYRARSAGKKNTIGRAAAREVKQVLTNDKGSHLLDKRLAAAQHSRLGSDEYKKALKASQDHAKSRRGKK